MDPNSDLHAMSEKELKYFYQISDKDYQLYTRIEFFQKLKEDIRLMVKD